MSPAELRSLVVSSVSATFRSGSRLRSAKTFPAMYQFMESFYKLARLPPQGIVPQFKVSSAEGFLPALETFGSADFVVETLQINYPGWCRLPIRGTTIDDMVWARKGLFFRGLGGRETSALVKMGVLRVVKKMSALYAGEDGLNRAIQEYTSSEPAEFIFECLEDWVDAFGSDGIPGTVATYEATLDIDP